MTTLTRARIAALLLIIGSLAFSVGDLIRRLVVPTGSPKAPAITAAVGDHAAVWQVAALLAVVAGLCLVPAVLALLPQPHRAGSATTTVGVVMVAVGALASIGHAVAFYAPYALFADATTSDDQLTALDKASESSPVLVALIIAFIVGMMLGSIVLFIGLRRARRVPIWAVVAAVVFVGCGSSGGVVPGVLGIAAALAAFVPAARAITTEDRQGTRPVGGDDVRAGLSTTFTNP